MQHRYSIAFWCIISTFLVFSDAQQRERAAWISGNFTSLGTDVYSNYVDKGVPSSRAYPGGRYNFQSAYDQTRREVWIYGGTGYGSPAQVPAIMLNDLWVFRLHDSRWIWFSGNGSASYRSSTYGPLGTPGTSYSPESRISPAGWINPVTREYFLYGGSDGGGGRILSDIWRFRPSDMTWTWMAGTSASDVAPSPGPRGSYGSTFSPGARYSACSMYDPINNEGYMFGGVTNVLFFDLWKIRFNDTYMALVAGNTTASMRATTTGKGIASTTFNPSARLAPACAFDYLRREIYVFGGRGILPSGSNGVLNDLWRYSLNDSTWTWLTGELTGAQLGNYGSIPGVGIPGVTVPPSRVEAMAWFDVEKRQFGLHGGSYTTSLDTSYADNWIYDVNSNNWIYTDGGQLTNVAGVYKPLNVASAGFQMRSRAAGAAVFDQNTKERLIMLGLVRLGGSIFLNDIWLIQRHENCSIVLSGFNGTSCRRYIDTNAIDVTLPVPIAPLAMNSSQCGQLPYSTLQVSTCGSAECVLPGSCPIFGNVSDYSSTADLCYTNYSTGSCPSGSACDNTGTCKVLLGQTCTASSQCNSSFCETPGRCCMTPCNASQTCSSAGECKMRSGQSCNVNDDCITGSCGSNGICCESTCEISGSACAPSTGQCRSRCGQNCTGSQTTCFEGLCSSAGLCCAQNCSAGFICIGTGGCLGFFGSTCRADSDCISNTCTQTKCCATTCADTESCGTDGACKTIAGRNCTSDDSCLTGFCGLNSKCCLAANCTCNDMGQCLKPAAALCSTGTECLSGFCSASGHCCDSSCSGSCDTCQSGTCTAILNAPSARCPQINCSNIVAGWQGNTSRICHRYDGVLPGVCGSTASCNTTIARCVSESSIVPILGASCAAESCKGDCPAFEQVPLYSSPRDVCLIGESCGADGRVCSALGDCLSIAAPINTGDNSVSAPVSGALSPGAILGIIIACVAGVIAIIVVAFLIARKRREQALEIELTEEMKAGFNIKPSDLSVSKKLGEGSYGVVYLGTYKGKQVAVKRLAMTMFANAIADFLAEAMLIMSVKKHPNVINTFGMCQERSNLSLVMEFLPLGSLLDLIEREHEQISELDMWKFAKGIALGMESLASQQIVHRDLACRNILLDADRTPKVADFGYARVVSEASGSGKTSATVGPIRWMAPESIGEQVYSEATDVWAFGCVLLELVTREEPFAGKPIVDVAVYVRDTKKHAEIPQGVPQWMRELMEQCWAPMPKDRPRFSEIVEFLELHKPGRTKRAQSKHSPQESSSSSS